jgi:cytochrome b involved in lipid metabolism
VTGKDATESFEDIGHSDEAREILEKYHIGELDAAVSETRQKKSASESMTNGFLPSFIIVSC